MRVDQIGYQEAGPGVPGFWIRNNEYIIRENDKVAARSIQPESLSDTTHYALQHREQDVTLPQICLVQLTFLRLYKAIE